MPRIFTKVFLFVSIRGIRCNYPSHFSKILGHESAPMLQLTDVYKSYTPQTPVLTAINLTVAAGEIVCLLGPSGCGKTTLLRIVAGLEQADRGTVVFDGQDLAQVPVHKRNFGLMFQDFALFPHKTVG